MTHFTVRFGPVHGFIYVVHSAASGKVQSHSGNKEVMRNPHNPLQQTSIENVSKHGISVTNKQEMGTLDRGIPDFTGAIQPSAIFILYHSSV